MTAGIKHLAPSAPRAGDADTVLAGPVGAVAEGLAPARAVTLAVNDPQRATRTDAVLRRLAPALGGKALRLLVATGTHRFGPEARQAFERRFRTVVGDCQPPCWRSARSRSTTSPA
ncbi:MAG: hypothetical protein ACYS5V_00650 [Planctomycetota bacterium]|jgi:hypothetical protein